MKIKSISEALWFCQVNHDDKKTKWWWYMWTECHIGEWDNQGNERVSPDYKTKLTATRSLKAYLKRNRMNNWEMRD